MGGIANCCADSGARKNDLDTSDLFEEKTPGEGVFDAIESQDTESIVTPGSAMNSPRSQLSGRSNVSSKSKSKRPKKDIKKEKFIK